MGVEDRNRACVEALERYVVACGGSADLVKNWTVTRGVRESRRWRRRDAHPTQATVETRKEGDTAGTYDVYYFDPAGKRYRSRAEVARAFFLAVPQRRTKAASTFGRTKKGRRRAAHAKRFAACTQHLRAALGRVLDDEQEAVDPDVLRKQHAEADDRGSKSVAAANSKAERLLQKLEEAREKEAGARGRLAEATENLRETPLPEASPELLAAVRRSVFSDLELDAAVRESHTGPQGREPAPRLRAHPRDRPPARVSHRAVPGRAGPAAVLFK